MNSSGLKRIFVIDERSHRRLTHLRYIRTRFAYNLHRVDFNTQLRARYLCICMKCVELHANYLRAINASHTSFFNVTTSSWVLYYVWEFKNLRFIKKCLIDLNFKNQLSNIWCTVRYKAFVSRLWRVPYKTHIRPHFEHAIQAWSPYLLGDISVLQLLMNTVHFVLTI